MAIDTIDIKLLWGRAGGRCSMPGCPEDLTALIQQGRYVVGEMAHIIGRRPTARRASARGGPDKYDNLILLCPTHHTHIDKAPEGSFPAELLSQWKREHEFRIRSALEMPKVTTFGELRHTIAELLSKNKAAFDSFGPHSEFAMHDPQSNLFGVWEMKRLDCITPNNRRILNLLDANAHLIPKRVKSSVLLFRAHAEAYEQHIYRRLDSYPLFPIEFAKYFEK